MNSFLTSHQVAIIAIGAGVANLIAPVYMDALSEVESYAVSTVGAGGAHVLHLAAQSFWNALTAPKAESNS